MKGKENIREKALGLHGKVSVVGRLQEWHL